MKKATCFLLLALFVGATQVGLAVTKTWLSAAGGNSTKWDRAANWSPSGVPTSGDDVVIPTAPTGGSGFPVLDVNASALSVAISSGASVTGATGFSLTVAGSVSGAGTLNGAASTMNIAGGLTVSTFTAGTSTIVLNGTSAQSLGGYTFNNFTVNNSAGLTLTIDIGVGGTLTLTNGVVTTGANKINVTSNLEGAVVITAGSVNGELQRPVIHPPGGPAQVYQFTDQNTAIILPASTDIPQQTISVISYPGTPAPNQQGGLGINRYYTVTVPGSLTAALRLAYLDGELNGVGESDLAMFRYQSGWGLLAGSAVDSANNFMELAGVSTWSDWTMGSASNPLPIQLGSFTGVALSNGHVRLNWMTLSELNNYGFEVQRSTEAATGYETIPNSFVQGHGTTTEPQYYTYTDVTSTPGSWYYRLKQYDLDATVHYTEGIQIDILTGVGDAETIPVAFEVSQNYPNPFNPSTSIKFALPERTHVTLRVYNLLGKEVATLVNGDFSAGRHDVQWNASDVASGVYMYRIQAGNFVETRKLTLIK